MNVTRNYALISITEKRKAIPSSAVRCNWQPFFLLFCVHKNIEKMKLNSLSDLQRFLPKAERPLSSVRPEEKSLHNGKGKSARVFLETQGRKGKSVTIVTGLHHNPATMEEIARILKQYCGAGGTVKEGNIEIQGDQRGRVKEKLQEIGYIIKE